MTTYMNVVYYMGTPIAAFAERIPADNFVTDRYSGKELLHIEIKFEMIQISTYPPKCPSPT